ncbi:MAG: hypothetical protein P8189_03595 [Anaerolineae bacterium]
MKTTIPFLETGHLLEHSDKGCFRLDTDNPILGTVDERWVEQGGR